MIEVNYNALRQAIRTLGAGILAIVTSHYFPSSANYWVILSACLLVQVRAGDLFYQHIRSQFLVGLTAAIAVFFSSYFGKSLAFLSIFLAITSFVTVYVGFRWRHLFFAAYIVNLLAMMGGGMSADLKISAIRREDVVVGMVLAMIATFSFWPSYMRYAIKNAQDNCKIICRKTLALVFSIYLMHDYIPNYFDYEKKLYQLSREFFHWSHVYLRLCKKTNRKNKWEHIFQLIIALGLLRYRVKDHTTFEVIDQDLKEVLAALNDGMSKPWLPGALNESIERLEESYRNALQVVAQEPLVFLFFIQDLRALAKELENASD